MAVKIGQAEPGFEDPIGLLAACHRRIERFLGVLCRAAEAYDGADLDAATRASLTTALRYFREAAPHHTEDEEEDLFPMLAGSEDGIATLQDEHRHAEDLHAQVDRLGAAWLEKGWLTENELASLRTALRELASLYEAHIAFEEKAVFPAARRVLGKAELREMGRHMAARRGVNYIPSVVPFGT